MAIVQQPDPPETEAQKSKKRKRKRAILFTSSIFLVVVLLIAIAQVLSNLQVIPAVWSAIASTIVGGIGSVCAYFSLLPVIFPSDNAPVHVPIIIHSNALVAPAPVEHQIAQPVVDASDPQKVTFRVPVGLLPLTDIRSILPRADAVADVYGLLTEPDVSAVVLTGIGGVGKSTLAALVYHFAEDQWEAGNGPFQARPIWLTMNYDVTLFDLVGTLLEEIALPLPDFAHFTPENQAIAFFNALKNLEQSRLIVLDQFENFLNWQTGFARKDRPGVGEWLDTINNQSFGASGCRILLTSRLLPKGAHAYPLAHLRNYKVAGLNLSEGIALLHKQGEEATIPEQYFRQAVERCDGHPYALTLLAALLQNHHMTLVELFQDPAYEEVWVGTIAYNILDYIYESQLSELQRRLLLAFSVFREAVSHAAVWAVLDFQREVARKDLLQAITVLISLHLLQAPGSGHYELHAIVRNYAHHHFAHDDQINRQLLYAARVRAAEYYQQQAFVTRPPSGIYQTIKEVQALIEAIWQLSQARHYAQAYALVEREQLFDILDRLGGSSILLEVYTSLLPLSVWNPSSLQAALIYRDAGRTYHRFGQWEKSRDYYNQALALYRTAGDSAGEFSTLFYLGEIYHTLGPITRTLEVYEEALTIARKSGNRKGEARTLSNLCGVYKNLGDMHKGRTYGEQALQIFQDIGDLSGEARCFDELGDVYYTLGQIDEALHSFQKAHELYKELKDYWQEGWMLVHQARIYQRLGQIEQAQINFSQAIAKGQQVGNRFVEGAALMGIGDVHLERKQWAHADECYKRALVVSRAIKDTWGECRTLHHLGQLSAKQEQYEQALGYLSMAFAISREIGNHLETIGILYDAGRIYVAQQRYDVAQAFLLYAQTECGKSQSTQVDEIQELMDQIHTDIGEQAFLAISQQVEPEFIALVERTLADIHDVV